MSLEKLQVGDKVFITSAGFKQQLATVDRLTATQIVVENSKYSKGSGKLIGGSGGWYCQYIHPATDQQIAEYQEERLRKRLINAIVSACEYNKLEQLDTDKLKEIIEIVLYPQLRGEDETR
jgi:hypothetical protein